MKGVLWLCFFFIPSFCFSKCVCGIDDPIKSVDKIKEKYVVVKGRVVKSEPLSGINWTYDLATVKVEEYWYGKGKILGKYLNIYNGYGGNCAYYFDVGESYLFYLYLGENIPSTSICTPTKPLVWALHELLFMGTGKRPNRRVGSVIQKKLVHTGNEDIRVNEGYVGNHGLLIFVLVCLNMFLALLLLRKRLFRRSSIRLDLK